MNAARDFLPRWDFMSVDDEAVSVEVRDEMSEFANDPTTARRSWTPAAAWPTGGARELGSNKFFAVAAVLVTLEEAG